VEESKQDKIIEALKRRAEDMRFGTITCEFKVQDGKILAGEIIMERVKLG